MLPAETIKEIERLATQNQPTSFRPAGEPDHVYYLRNPDGSYGKAVISPSLARHTATDIETLCQIVCDNSDDENAPEVWYGRGGIVAILQPDAIHPERCRFDLSPSPQLAKLIDWDKSGGTKPMQGEFIILLRTLFAGCAPDSLLPAVRQVKTSKAADVNSKIEQGKVSLGKSMIAEMTGINAIPEEVAFTVPVFAQAAVRMVGQVRVAIDPDPETSQFRLIVLPGDIERVFVEAESSLATRIHETLVEIHGGEHPFPVYRGTP